MLNYSESGSLKVVFDLSETLCGMNSKISKDISSRAVLPGTRLFAFLQLNEVMFDAFNGHGHHFKNSLRVCAHFVML